MGVLLMAEGIHPRMELNPVKLSPVNNAHGTGVSQANGIIIDVNDSNNATAPITSSRVVSQMMIDDNNVDDGKDEPARWMPPPPKKKWIRHYLLGERDKERERDVVKVPLARDMIIILLVYFLFFISHHFAILNVLFESFFRLLIPYLRSLTFCFVSFFRNLVLWGKN